MNSWVNIHHDHEIIIVVKPDGYVAAVNPNDIKALLANGLSIFFINGKPVFINCP